MNILKENKVLVAVLAIVAVLSVAWVLTASPTGLATLPTDSVKIGAILPLTGDGALVGTNIQQGIQLAADEINQSGGLAGKKVEVLFEDDQYDNSQSVTAANKLVDSDKVSASIIALIHGAKSVQPIFEEKKTPLVVAWDSTIEIENANYVFSTGFSTEAAGKKMAGFAFDDLRLRKIAVVLHQDEWSEIIAPAFKEEFESKGGRIVLFEKVAVGEEDFRTVLSKVKSANADGVYFPLVPVNSDIFMKQTKELGLNATLLSGDALIPDVISAAGDAAEGVYLTNISAEDNAVSQHLLESYRKKFGKEPDAFPMVAFGYDAMMSIAKAAESSGGTDSESIARGLYSVDFEGAGGRIKINADGLSGRTEKIYQIRSGEPILVK